MSSGVYERTPEIRAKMRKAHLGIPHTSPAQIAADKAQRGVPHHTPSQIAYDEARTGVPRTPEARAAMSISRKGVPKSPEHIAAIKEATKKFCGGNDLVIHHYIYDHADLSLNTVQMTRSDHTSLHRLLQKLGYIVPHINIEETEMDNQKVYKV